MNRQKSMRIQLSRTFRRGTTLFINDKFYFIETYGNKKTPAAHSATGKLSISGEHPLTLSSSLYVRNGIR